MGKGIKFVYRVSIALVGWRPDEGGGEEKVEWCRSKNYTIEAKTKMFERIVIPQALY